MASGRYILISVKKRHVEIFLKRKALMPSIKIIDYAKVIPTTASVFGNWIKKYARQIYG